MLLSTPSLPTPPEPLVWVIQIESFDSVPERVVPLDGLAWNGLRPVSSCPDWVRLRRIPPPRAPFRLNWRLNPARSDRPKWIPPLPDDLTAFLLTLAVNAAGGHGSFVGQEATLQSPAAVRPPRGF